MIKSVIWASMLDYPGHVCTSIFFDKCNFNCEFCQNKHISQMKDVDFNREILPKLLERKELVGYIILSGGECTIDKDIENIIDKLYKNGFKVGLHTNGYKPELLKRNIDKISYIGMDVKNDLNNYDEISGIKIDTKEIKESIDLIINSGIEYEFRTTIYPKYLSKENCVNIAKYLGKRNAKKYTLQQYKRIEGLDVIPFSEAYLKETQEECNKYIKTNLRGI